MTERRFELHEDAAAKYDAALDWYLQRSPEAASRFDLEFQRAVEHILEGPEQWASGPYSTRRYLLRRFPFLVIYRERPADIQIIAVAHTSRRPAYWKERV